MLKSLSSNKNAFIGLTLSQLGLMIATSILLISVSTLLFHDSRVDEEMNQLTTVLSSQLEQIHLIWYEEQMVLELPEMDPDYEILLSPLSVSIESNTNNQIIKRESLFIKLFLRNSSQEWSSASELHNQLKETFGNTGLIDDPVNDINLVKQYLQEEWNRSLRFFSIHPISIYNKYETIIEKVLIFCDENNDKNWSENEKTIEYVLLYQRRPKL